MDNGNTDGTFERTPTVSDLAEAIDKMKGELSGHTGIALGMHLTSPETMSIAMVFWAAGHTKAAHSITQVMLDGDDECIARLTAVSDHTQVEYCAGLDVDRVFYRDTRPGTVAEVAV